MDIWTAALPAVSSSSQAHPASSPCSPSIVSAKEAFLASRSTILTSVHIFCSRGFIFGQDTNHHTAHKRWCAVRSSYTFSYFFLSWELLPLSLVFCRGPRPSNQIHHSTLETRTIGRFHIHRRSTYMPAISTLPLRAQALPCEWDRQAVWTVPRLFLLFLREIVFFARGTETCNKR